MSAGSGTGGKAKTVDPEKTQIAWFPDEGCYRTVTSEVETATVGGIEVSVEVAVPGDKVVWVDDAPSDESDGAGHFESYVGAADDYLPQVAAVEG